MRIASVVARQVLDCKARPLVRLKSPLTQAMFSAAAHRRLAFRSERNPKRTRS